MAASRSAGAASATSAAGRIRPASPGSQSFEPPDSPRSFRWYLFAGFETRLVGRNIFLDGNTFRSSHSVEKNPVVTDLRLGIATVLFDKVRLTYTDNVQTYDLNIPTWPFYAVAWTGDVCAVILIAIRTWRLIFSPELLEEDKPADHSNE